MIPGRAQAEIASAAYWTGNLVSGCRPFLKPRLAGLPSGRGCGAGEPWAPVRSTVMSAMPLMIPLVILLMRKLRTTEVQL